MTEREHWLVSSKSIDGVLLKELLIAGSRWLDLHTDQVNALNVFPVPDGDTGTNMVLTLNAALSDIEGDGHNHVGLLAVRASQGALLGARGNSGVILSQILSGFSEAVKDKSTLSLPQFARALKVASDQAYQAVLHPVEGTILTVIKAVAQAALRIAQRTLSLEIFLNHIWERGKIALQLTPELLPMLKEAGVVDSGGQGLVYFLEGMVRHLQGLPLELPSDSKVESGTIAHFSATSPGFSSEDQVALPYDVQFLIQGQNLDVATIRQSIDQMGQSALVVGGSNLLKVHVHVADPEVPLQYGLSQGTVSDVVVEDMLEQVRLHQTQQALTAASIAIIAVAPGAGLAQIFASLGAAAIISGGQTSNPSTQDFLEAINRVESENIIILPNNKNIISAAQQAATLSRKSVTIIPTGTIPQGISAIVAFQPDDTLKANLQRINEAIQDVETFEVTHATRDAFLQGKAIKAGESLVLSDETLVAAGPDAAAAVQLALSKRDLANFELVTIYYGADVSVDDAQHLSELIIRAYSHLTVEILAGDQFHYPYIISLE